MTAQEYQTQYKSQGKNYTIEQIQEGIDYLSYKHPNPLPKLDTPEGPNLFVFRHGQTTDNVNFIFSGWRDVSITELGKQQAEKLIDQLKDKKIQMLITSDQKRSVETMKISMSGNIFAKNLEINQDPRIKERSYGIYQGQCKLDYYLDNKELLHTLRRSFDHVPEEGESLAMVCKRVASFCDEITSLMKKTGISVAVSCHGNSIRGFRKYFENIDNDALAGLETPLGQDYLAYSIK